MNIKYIFKKKASRDIICVDRGAVVEFENESFVDNFISSNSSIEYIHKYFFDLQK
ncbi:MAG: hypothetical protein HOM96_05275 [Rickettsiales bacterium]|nr:hypothetical protein [Rickettsiales bacterium]